MPETRPVILSRTLVRPQLRPLGVALALSALAAGTAHANQSLFSPGYGLTVGPVFNRNNLNSAGYNPANPVRLVGDDEKVRIGVVQVGGQYELGNARDIQNSIDRIDAAVTAAQAATNETQVQEQVNIVNGLLPELDRGARFGVAAGGSLLTPLLVRSEALAGVVSVQANAQLQAAGFFRSSNAEIVRDNLGNATGLRTASAFDVKAAAVTQLSLGYGRDIGPWLKLDSARGKVDAGVRLNAYQAKLYRQLVGFTDENGNANSGNFDRDSVDSRSASAVAADLGLAWSTEHYRLGATVYNLGAPKFKYPDPSRDANAANRYAATTLAANGKIGLDDAVALKTHVVLEGSLYSANQRWLAQASYALNETPNFVGDPQQYATASVSYNAERFEGAAGTLLNYIVPSVRLGYRKNLVGDKLATVGLGLSWGVLNVDLNASPESVTADGSKVPRTAGFSLSIAEKF